MQDETTLYLPPTLQFPVKIVSLAVHPLSSIKKHDVLLVYEHRQQKQEKNVDPLTGEESIVNVERVTKSEFESAIEGIVKEWIIKPGTLVMNSGQRILTVIEECNHPTQFNGLCAICGKDLTISDYTGFSDTSRATISMTHDSTGLKVSASEASRIERETTQRLLKQKKLSLIVDLDQTIIHATVDPTVGEWMEDPNGANYRAVADVEKFKLFGDFGGGNEGWYYVKMRPGLKHFLKEISKIYELHIYTMGTRNYATAVAKIIDPNQELFGERVLSRDESGSMTAKLIERLFPVDTSMVVVIDDRADIWAYSPNLVKVVPYDFFVGIGDINASFLPKRKEIPGEEVNSQKTISGEKDNNMSLEKIAEKEEISMDISIESDEGKENVPMNRSVEMEKTIEKENLFMKASENVSGEKEVEIEIEIENVSINNSGRKENISLNESLDADDADADVSIQSLPISKTDNVIEIEKDDESIDSSSKTLLLPEETEDKQEPNNEEKKVTDRALTDLSERLEQQKHDRPLAKKQQELEKVHKAVLHDDDKELILLEGILKEIHSTFFGKFESNGKADVKEVIPKMKSRVLSGVDIAFSGVVPIGVIPESIEIVKMAIEYGARVRDQVDMKRITHLVAAKPGTMKVNKVVELYRREKMMRRIEIVRPEWLIQSINQWKKLDEREFRLFSQGDVGGNEQEEVEVGVERVGGLSEERSISINESMFESEEIDFDDMDWGDAMREVEEAIGESESEVANTSGDEENQGQNDLDNIQKSLNIKKESVQVQKRGIGMGMGIIGEKEIGNKRIKYHHHDKEDMKGIEEENGIMKKEEFDSDGSMEDFANDLEAELS